MSPEDQKRLEDIEERADAATEGPWLFRYTPDGHKPTIWVSRVPGVSVPPKFMVAFLPEMANGDSAPDGRFLAAAREDIPWLVAKVRELEEELRPMRDLSAIFKDIVEQREKIDEHTLRELAKGDPPADYSIMKQIQEDPESPWEKP